MNIQSRLRTVVAAILAVVLYGSLGYYLIFEGRQSLVGLPGLGQAQSLLPSFGLLPAQRLGQR